MAEKKQYIRKLCGYYIKDEEARKRLDSVDTTIANIKDGTQTVGAAINVTSSINGKSLSQIFESDGITAKKATGATNDSKGNNIADTYATKNYVDINGGKIDKIVLGTTPLEIADKTVTIATQGTYSNENPLVTKSVVTDLEKDITGYAKGYTFDKLKLDKGEQSFGEKILLNTLANESTGKQYKVGDSLYVLENNVPDYWVAEVKGTSGGINELYNSDNVLIGYTAGYYVIYELETAKVDLSSYAKFADVAKIEQVTSLPTTGEEHTLYVIKASSGKKTETVRDFIAGEGLQSKPFTVQSTIGTGIDERDISTSVTPISATNVTTSYNASSGVLTISGYVPTSVSSVTVTINWQTGGRIGAIYENGNWYYIPITSEDGAVAKAQADANGNVIHTTYATKTSVNEVVANTTLKAAYADEELTLYIKDEREASATT